MDGESTVPLSDAAVARPTDGFTANAWQLDDRRNPTGAREEMGREVRRVPKHWQHSRRANGQFRPLFDEAFDVASNRWKTGLAAWERRDAAYFEFEDAGRFEEFGEYWEYVGEPPARRWYRPNWSDAERTHFQMYENVSEGTPISSVMESPEALARWLADNGANAGAGTTATYEQWLAACRGRPAPTLSVCDDEITSGVVGNAR